jgi:hypothetical protein
VSNQSNLTIGDPRIRQNIRRLALFLAMLMSGGLLIFDRTLLLAGLVLVSMLLVNPIDFMRREMARIWFVLGAIAVATLIGGDGFHLQATAVRYANFIAAVFLVGIYLEQSRDTLAKDLLPILAFMSVQALLTVILSVVASNYFMPYVVGETVHYTIGFVFTFHRVMEIRSLLDRPDGFFFEPGVFQLYLNIYLFIAINDKTLRQRNIHVGLALAGVLCTQSTTGIIIAFFILGMAYLRRLKTAAMNEKLLILVLVPLLLLPLAGIMVENIQDKLFGIFRGSAWARQYDFFTGMRVALERPLTGIGFSYERYFEFAQHVGYLETQLDIATITERPNSNGIATLLYSIGFPLAGVMLWGLFKQRFFADRTVLFFVFLVSLSTEAIIFTPFPLMFIYSGLLLSRRAVARGSHQIRTAPQYRPRPPPQPRPQAQPQPQTQPRSTHG